jgi:hypothetical protein
VADAVTLIKLGAKRFELEALELYRGCRSFVENRDVLEDLDASFQTPLTRARSAVGDPASR